MKPRPVVLLVDDNPQLAIVFARLLRSRFDVEIALTIDEAKARLDTVGIDAALVDFSMQPGSGIDLYDYLAAKRPGDERRIVFMTGGAVDSRTDEFMARTTNRVIEKIDYPNGVIEALTEAAKR